VFEADRVLLAAGRTPTTEKDIRTWVKARIDNPKPFIWTKSADEILASLGRLLQRTTGAGH
jgi:hypothetical protein